MKATKIEPVTKQEIEKAKSFLVRTKNRAEGGVTQEELAQMKVISDRGVEGVTLAITIRMPVLGNGFARVEMMPSGLADRIANQVAS